MLLPGSIAASGSAGPAGGAQAGTHGGGRTAVVWLRLLLCRGLRWGLFRARCHRSHLAAVLTGVHPRGLCCDCHSASRCFWREGPFTWPVLPCCCSSHPHVAALVATYEDEKAVHLLLELCEGGELFERIAGG